MIDSEGNKKTSEDLRLGTIYGMAAYVLWGVLPLYWKQLANVNSLQILAHRILWASVFSVALLVVRRRTGDMRGVFREKKRLAAAVLSGALVTINWGVYIWAVNSGNIVESSVGYYISPLFVVLSGAFFLKEKLDRGLLVSLGIALVGILVLTIDYGRIPWIALILALSWTAYSYVKKQAALDPLAGLAVETLSMTPLATAFLIWAEYKGMGSFVQDGALTTALLVLSGPVTALPLLFYAAGVTRIPLSRIGPIQFISPTLQLAIGVLVYHEPFGGVRAAAFACIASALVVFALTRGRRNP